MCWRSQADPISLAMHNENDENDENEVRKSDDGMGNYNSKNPKAQRSPITMWLPEVHLKDALFESNISDESRVCAGDYRKSEERFTFQMMNFVL